MINSVSLSKPFDYYTIKSTKPDNNGIFQRAAHTAQESFKNLAYYFCNGLISCANALQLYKLRSSEKGDSFEPTSMQSLSIIFASLSATLTPNDTWKELLSATNFLQLTSSLKSSYKKVIALAGFVFRDIPIAGVVYQSWETYHVTKGSLKGLRLCFSSKGQPLAKRFNAAILHAANIAQSIFSLHEGLIDFGSTYNSDFSKIFSAGVHGSKFNNMSDEERIMSDKLNPENPHDAKIIINPDSSRKEDIQKSCRNKRALYHPDSYKGKENKDWAQARCARVGQACNTLLKPRKK